MANNAKVAPIKTRNPVTADAMHAFFKRGHNSPPDANVSKVSKIAHIAGA
jgi:hypothetical protein